MATHSIVSEIFVFVFENGVEAVNLLLEWVIALRVDEDSRWIRRLGKGRKMENDTYPCSPTISLVYLHSCSSCVTQPVRD